MPHCRLTALWIILAALSAVTGAQATTPSEGSVRLGRALESLQKLAITVSTMEKECAESFPMAAGDNRATVRAFLQGEAVVVLKVSETWKRLSAERPRDVQAFYWVSQRRLNSEILRLKGLPESERAFEGECIRFFRDIKSGALRRAMSDSFSLVQSFADDPASATPTYPFLDAIAKDLSGPGAPE